MAGYNLGEARGKIILETDLSGMKDGQKAVGDFKKQAGDSADSASQAWGKVGTSATVAGAVVAAGFGVAIKSASDFEYGMSAIQAVSGATASEMDLIRDAALRIGADTSFSAGEAAMAMEELIKAGISVEDTLGGAADATVALAAAGGVDLPTAATIAANAMNQFNLDAEDMVNVSDKIAGAANASAIDVGQFGQSMSQAGAVANLAGLSFDDTTLAIAAMGNAGIVGSDAGTSLKSMLMNLQPTTKEQTDLFRELGIMTLDTAKATDFLTENGFAPLSSSAADVQSAMWAMATDMAGVGANSDEVNKVYEKLIGNTDLMSNSFYDQEGKLKSLAEISDVLNGSLAGMTDAQKQATLETMFGSDAIRAAAIVADTGSKGFAELSANIDKVSAADVAATRLDNLQGSTEALMGSLETLWITIGSQLIPVFRSIVDSITEAVNWFSSLDSSTQGLIMTIAGVAGGFLLVSGGVIKMVQGMAAARAAILAITGATGLLTAAQTAQGAAQGRSLAQMVAGTAVMIAQKVAMVAGTVATAAATAAQWLFNAALTANPIGLVIAAVAALVAGLIWFFTQTELGQQIWQGFMTWLQEAWANISSFLTTVWEGIVTVATTVWNAVMEAVGAVVDWFKTYVQPTIDAVIKFITDVFNNFRLGMAIIWLAIKAAVDAVVKWFKGNVQPAIDAFVKFISKLFEFFGDLIAIVWNGIKSVIQTVVSTIVSWVTARFNDLKTFFTNVWNGIKAVFKTVWDAIWGFLKPIITNISNFIRDTFNNVKTTVSTIFNNVKGVISSVWNAIYTVVSGIVRNVWNFIRNTWNGITSFVSTLFNNVKNAIKGPLDSALGFIGGIKDRVIGFFGGAGRWLVDAGRNIIQGFLDGLNAMLGNITGFFNNLTNMIPDIKGPEEKDKVLLTKNGRLIMQSLYNGLDKELGSVTGLLSGLNATIPASITQEISANGAAGGRAPVVINVTWHAAAGDGVSTRAQVMEMLGHASDLVREGVGND